MLLPVRNSHGSNESNGVFGFVSIHGGGANGPGKANNQHIAAETLPAKPLKDYKHWFDRAVEAEGLRDFTRYCLRHTFASRLLMSGVDLESVRDLVDTRTSR